jgi:hypothetical protein
MFSLLGLTAPDNGEQKLRSRRRQRLQWLTPLICAFSLLGVPSVHAQWLDGHNLLRICSPSGNERVFQPGLCSGYLMGVVDVADGLQQAGLTKQPAFCMPVDVPEAKIKDVVIDYLADNPKRCDTDAATLAIEALGKAYPCKK